LCIGLAFVVVCVAVIGIGGTRSATSLGNETASDELTTATATGQLARAMDSAYATGETAFLTPGLAERSRLLGFLYSSRLPAADAQLYSVERLHADDPPAELAGIERLGRQWAAVRDLLSPTSVAAHPTATLAAHLDTAYQPVSAHLDRLLRIEQQDGNTDRVAAAANQEWTMGFIVGAAVLGLAAGAVLLLSGIRRIRRNLEPGQDQAEFADTLQVANDEDEAHQLLQRHLDSVGQAAPVLANLRNLAVAEIRAATDGLTGLPNKRAVTDAMKRLFAQATTTASPLALLLIDLDHFKQINDQWGHPVGDQVLASIGAVLRSVLRARDFAGRNGGEEFAVLLPDTGIPAALEIAERIRTAITEISLPGTDVSVAASLGVVGFPDHATTLDRLERLADAALYIAKRQGRNRVELADPAATDSPATDSRATDPPAADPRATDPPATDPTVALDTRA
jgi:diguanylate cyclase (GGDEF)-like protein